VTEPPSQPPAIESPRSQPDSGSARHPEDSKLALVHRFFAGTGGTYDFMVNFATFGIDRLWKRRIVDLMPKESERVLDLACGTGISTLAIARRYPRSRLVGVELREEYLEIAREKIRRLGFDQIKFVLCRAEDYRSEEPFDCITSSYLAKYADLATLIPNAKAMLKEGGLLLMHDFTLPPKAYLVRIWRGYFKALQWLGSPLFPAWKPIYFGLPELIERTRWVEELIALLKENGFTEIQKRDLTLYGSAIVTARKPREANAPERT
jgi:demethylmenaquinone methyltransferase / 2-methoxy-6-polyprenyl-1,4-benzoquinol methylase